MGNLWLDDVIGSAYRSDLTRQIHHMQPVTLGLFQFCQNQNWKYLKPDLKPDIMNVGKPQIGNG